jgi:hypothetical protein
MPLRLAGELVARAGREAGELVVGALGGLGRCEEMKSGHAAVVTQGRLVCPTHVEVDATVARRSALVAPSLVARPSP